MQTVIAAYMKSSTRCVCWDGGCGGVWWGCGGIVGLQEGINVELEILTTFGVFIVILWLFIPDS